MIVAGIATFACVALVALLLACHRAGARRGVIVCKTAASTAFLAVAAGHLAAGGDPGAYAALIVVGLIFGAGGDVALLGRGRRAFLLGLGLFLAGHIAYVMACASLVSPDGWLSPAAAVPVAAALAALAYLGPHVGSMRAPVALYVAAITTMVIGALAVALAAPVDGLDTAGAYLLAAGAGSFFISDLAVARNQFVAPGFVNRAWGLPAYYGGQLFIAWSLAFAA